ncbi:MAG TPA: DUF5683 domain-containing protein [Terriglobales bacterium]|nr:DUF5683 domain-containing protein [Terriglobales bacterium]
MPLACLAIVLVAAAARAQEPAAVDTAARGAVPRIVTPRGAAPDTTTPPVLRPPRATAPDTISLRSPRRRAAILGPDSTGARRRSGKGFLTAPRWVMLRSLIFPGWGQLENRAWLKALILGGADGYLRVRAIDDERRIRRLLDETNQAKAAYDLANLAYADSLAAHGDTTSAPGVILAGNALGAANIRYNDLANSYNSLLNGQVSRLWLLGGVVVYAMIDAYVDAHFRNFKIEFEQDPALPGGRPGSGQTRLYLRWAF